MQALGRIIASGRPKFSAALLLCAFMLGAMLLFDATRPGVTVPGAPPIAHFDKVAHFAAHFLLASLLCWALLLARPTRMAMPRAAWMAALAALVLDLVLGAGVEWTQATLGQVHGRRAEAGDLAANALGALAACAAFLCVARSAFAAYINRPLK
ncbi:hypothetical protein EDM80_13485 [bacterium]|nr:MAG: hypothetical protein EDM80_13485 [bacterium]RIK61876.1 MAG: hypothetical protein DCC64_11960 [Planctomycetota bacterium]